MGYMQGPIPENASPGLPGKRHKETTGNRVSINGPILEMQSRKKGWF